MHRPILISVVVTLSLLLQWAPAGAQSATDKQKARDHFSIGVELLDETPPNYQRALTQFHHAYELSGSWKVLGNLGLCAHRLERDGEAAEFYGRYLDEGGAEISAAERRDIERDLLAINASLSKVKLTADVPQGSIIVHRTGSSVASQVYPLVGRSATLGLRAGAYRITLQADSKEQTWPVVLRPKSTVKNVFTINIVVEDRAEAAEAGGDGPDRSGVSAEAVTQGSTGSVVGTTGYVVGGVGLAALGAGVFFGLRANGQSDAAGDVLSSTCIDNVCPEVAQSEFDPARDSANIANALFIGGGILAAAGLVMVLVSENTSEEEVVSLQVQPTLHPHNLGLQIGGQF